MRNGELHATQSRNHSSRPCSFSAFDFSQKRDIQVAQKLIIPAAMDFVRSHPAITVIDFTSLLLVDFELLLQFSLDVLPKGQLRRLVAPLTPNLVSILRDNAAAVQNLHTYTSACPEIYTNLFSLGALVRVLSKSLRHLEAQNVALIATRLGRLVEAPKHPRRRTSPSSFSPNNEPSPQERLTILETISSQWSGLTHVQLGVGAGESILTPLTMLPNVEELSLFVEHSYDWQEPLPRAEISSDPALQNLKKLKKLTIFTLYPSHKIHASIFAVVGALGATLEEFNLVEQRGGPAGVSVLSDHLALCLSALVAVRRLKFRFFSNSIAPWIPVIVSSVAPTLRHLTLDSPIPQSILAPAARELKAKKIELFGSFLIGLLSDLPKPLYTSRKDILSIYAGQPYPQIDLDPNARIPVDASTVRASCDRCQRLLPSHDIESHQDVCPSRLHKCPNRLSGCDAAFPSSAGLNKHITTQCQHWVIVCVHCRESVLRSNWERHIDSHKHPSDHAYLSSRDMEWKRMRGPKETQFPFAYDIVLCPYCKQVSLPFREIQEHVTNCSQIELTAAIAKERGANNSVSPGAGASRRGVRIDRPSTVAGDALDYMKVHFLLFTPYGDVKELARTNTSK